MGTPGNLGRADLAIVLPSSDALFCPEVLRRLRRHHRFVRGVPTRRPKRTRTRRETKVPPQHCEGRLDRVPLPQVSTTHTCHSPSGQGQKPFTTIITFSKIFSIVPSVQCRDQPEVDGSDSRDVPLFQAEGPREGRGAVHSPVISVTPSEVSPPVPGTVGGPRWVGGWVATNFVPEPRVSRPQSPVVSDDFSPNLPTVQA